MVKQYAAVFLSFLSIVAFAQNSQNKEVFPTSDFFYHLIQKQMFPSVDLNQHHEIDNKKHVNIYDYNPILLSSWTYDSNIGQLDILLEENSDMGAGSKNLFSFTQQNSSRRKTVNLGLGEIEKPDMINPLMQGTIWGYTFSNAPGTKLDLRYSFD